MDYQARLDDIHFILHEVLKSPQELNTIASYEYIDADLMRQIVDEAGKFVSEKIAPLQMIGDAVGCVYNNGKVTTPPGFKEAYQAFLQAGWPALACADEDGGQALPSVLEAVLYEMLSGANHGWTMAPGLLHGAYECLKHHGTDALKARYLSKIASGEWLATMCLTEPHAGSDLGLARTKATPHADGSFLLSGTKIFISGGEHDLTDNIVHLVLARLPDAPPGPKGLSLFLAPKILENHTSNAIHCERIEEKMGLHGSATCVMRFDDAQSWLIGEQHRGLNAMFVMMNAARLHVGLQGIGLLEAAHQKALAYALERRQMRAPKQPMSATPDLIIEHPAVQRILSTQRAWIDAGRVIAYRTAIELDMLKLHAEESRRHMAQRWCSLVTPVLKSAWTAQAFHGSSDCLQVFGGHGYVRDWGIEQIVRDARVTMIYEGTNEIQAIDLLVRKVMPDGGAALFLVLEDLCHDLNASLAAHVELIHRATKLRETTIHLLKVAAQKQELAFWVADDYLRALTLVLMSWAWVKIDAAVACVEPKSQKSLMRWTEPEQALQNWILPEFDMRIAIIEQQITKIAI